MRLYPHAKTAALLLAGLYLIACAAAAPVSSAAATRTVAQALCALGYSSIPLRSLPSGHHIVDVSLNGRPATFVVDTGAGRTVIHRPYLETFGLQAGGGAIGTAIGAGGSTALSRASVDNLTIATTRTRLSVIYAIDLAHVVKALEPMVGKPVHGIIGQDIMQAQHAIIDVQQARLYLNPLDGEPRSGC